MKSTEQIMKEGKLLLEYRKLMGMRQADVMKILGGKQGNYSRMERGLLNSGDRLDKMHRIFKKWRDEEVLRLYEYIAYLNSL